MLNMMKKLKRNSDKKFFGLSSAERKKIAEEAVIASNKIQIQMLKDVGYKVVNK